MEAELVDVGDVRLVGLEGIQVWTCSADGWSLTRVPSTSLQAARTGYLSVLWIVTDHLLWRLPL